MRARARVPARFSLRHASVKTVRGSRPCNYYSRKNPSFLAKRSSGRRRVRLSCPPPGEGSHLKRVEVLLGRLNTAGTLHTETVVTVPPGLLHQVLKVPYHLYIDDQWVMTIFNDEQLLFTLLWIFTIMKYKTLLKDSWNLVLKLLFKFKTQNWIIKAGVKCS